MTPQDFDAWLSLLKRRAAKILGCSATTVDNMHRGINYELGRETTIDGARP